MRRLFLLILLLLPLYGTDACYAKKDATPSCVTESAPAPSAKAAYRDAKLSAKQAYKRARKAEKSGAPSVPAPQIEPLAEKDTLLTPSVTAKIAPGADSIAMPQNELAAYGTTPGVQPSLSSSPGTESTTSSVVQHTPKVTRQRFMPTARRIDREIDKHKFIYKNEWVTGLGATYATINSENTDLWVIFDKINLSGTVATIKPSVAYCFRDNRLFGVRFGYTFIEGNLDNIDVDLGVSNDISTSLSNITLSSRRYSIGFFHRTYVALDPHGRFSLFGDMELSAQIGTSRFAYKSGDEWKTTNSDNLTLKAWFSPGLSVFIFPNVSTVLSFGLGGFKYTRIDQKDDNGVALGTRTSSKMRFQLNLLEIGLGVNIHLWNNKKP